MSDEFVTIGHWDSEIEGRPTILLGLPLNPLNDLSTFE